MRLDRRVQFERASQVDDGFTTVEAFAPYGSPLPAAKTDLSDSERQRAGAVDASRMARFVIRYSEWAIGLTPKDRLILDGLAFNITGIKETGRRKQWLEISATAKVD